MAPTSSAIAKANAALIIVIARAVNRFLKLFSWRTRTFQSTLCTPSGKPAGSTLEAWRSPRKVYYGWIGHLKLSTPLSILAFADILASPDRFASRSNRGLKNRLDQATFTSIIGAKV
jgi:hypothetical protein